MLFSGVPVIPRGEADGFKVDIANCTGDGHAPPGGANGASANDGQAAPIAIATLSAGNIPALIRLQIARPTPLISSITPAPPSWPPVL